MADFGFNFDTTYMQLPNDLFVASKPDHSQSPKVIVLNHNLAISLGLDFSQSSVEEQAQLLAGQVIPTNLSTFSQAYAGHQFGHFTVLGDGRACILGEHVTPEGHRFDIQFKGCGKTPFSRGGDGKAVLGPMLREYIVSEGMHYLGIPTTRGLAVALTGESVMRQTLLPGAILTRVASSHIRVGTYEYASRLLDQQTTETLMDYTIQRHYPIVKNSENRALSLLMSVMERQIDLVVHWMRVGFIHGVMNSDNMSICGETLDYGPCAFMDSYNPKTVFSSIDHAGRYAYVNQPNIIQWNLARFAETLLPFIHDDITKAINIATDVVNRFPELYHEKWLAMMRAKLGLLGIKSEDDKLIGGLLNWMEKNQLDYTNTFRDLSQLEKPVGCHYDQPSFHDWYMSWRSRLDDCNGSLSEAITLMKETNPSIIPRNHKVEQALVAAYAGDFEPFKILIEVLRKPYSDQAIFQDYQKPPKPGERIFQTFCGT